MLSSFWQDCNCMAPMFLQATGHCFGFCIHPSHASFASVSSQCAPSFPSLQRSLQKSFLSLQQQA